MRVFKPQKPVRPEWLWQYDDDTRTLNFFESPIRTWLVFGIFYLDKFEKNPTPQVASLQERLRSLLNGWNYCYPWSEYEGIHLQIEEPVGRAPFIFGQICVEDNMAEEESLIVGLLQKFSSECTSQVFIKVCDTDGDFLLAEASDAIPEAYEYPVAINRLWLHQGYFKMISNDFNPSSGLEPSDALKFLEDMPYKLTMIDEINSKLSQKLTRNFAERVLSNLYRLPLVIEDEKCLNIIVSNPRIISFAIKNLINEEVTVNIDTPKTDTKMIEPLVPKRFCNILSMFLDAHHLKENAGYIPLYCGRAVSKVMDILLQNSDLRLNSVNGGTSEAPSEATRDFFGRYLFEKAPLDNKFDIESSDDSADVIAKKLAKFFQQDSTYDTGDGYEENEEEYDKEAKQFFRDQGVDIDEDDFFEFFISNALKIKGENIDSLRSQAFDDSLNDGSENSGSQDEEEISEDDSENFSQSELVDLLKSMSVGGFSNGPLQTILQSMRDN